MIRVLRLQVMLCVIVAALTGCASLKVVKVDPRITSQQYSTLVVADFENSVGAALPSRVQQDMSEAVVVHLNECYPGAFEKIVRSGSGYAEELVIRGSITEYQEGNRALRFLLAGLGSARVAADVSFHDGRSGEELMVAKGDWVFEYGGLMGAVVGIDDVVRSAGARIADLIADKKGATKKDTEACRTYAV